MSTPAIEHIHRDTRLQVYWLKRLLAGVIDFVIILFPLVFLDTMAAIILGPISRYYSLVFLAGVVWFIYSTLFEGMISTTPGKALLGLRVKSIHGKEVIFAQAAVRNLSRVFGLFLLLDLLVGFITEGDHRQKAMDRVSGTLVVMREG